jgi:hypothetical protein
MRDYGARKTAYLLRPEVRVSLLSEGTIVDDAGGIDGREFLHPLENHWGHPLARARLVDIRSYREGNENRKRVRERQRRRYLTRAHAR